MSFPWLVANVSGSSAGAARRHDVMAAELRDRAALLYRLGFSHAAAARRLSDEIAWEFDPPAKTGGPHRRPAALSDTAIAQLVREVYDRRPSLNL
jgi:hypothetical protein